MIGAKLGDYMSHKSLILTTGLLILAGCQANVESAPSTDSTHTATEAPFVSERVKSANAKVKRYLDFSDTADFERAKRGFIATFEDSKITKEDGSPVYDFGAYDFLAEDAPETVNPSLWRQSQLNALHGLFKVTDGIYQVRAYDLSNITCLLYTSPSPRDRG